MLAMKQVVRSSLALLIYCFSFFAWSQVIIEDEGVSLDRAELEQIISRWTPQMQQAAIDDSGDKLELINVALAAKKIAAEGDTLSPEVDGDTYWDYALKIRAAKQTYVLKHYIEALNVPDMTELSLERYESSKDKVARVPEVRLSSHILFKCPPVACDRAPLRVEVEKVLEELRSGVDFVEMVDKYSQDPGTKAKGGKFERWINIDSKGVSPPYVIGLYWIEEIGQYSDIVDSQFGLHIIRLDGVKEASYLPYAEVKDKLIKFLEQEYRTLSAKAYRRQFQISDKAFIDGSAVDEILSQYK
jgi:peptidyl-prolyl cis-trans isomerase C